MFPEVLIVRDFVPVTEIEFSVIVVIVLLLEVPSGLNSTIVPGFVLI